MIAALVNEPYMEQVTQGKPGPGARYIKFETSDRLQSLSPSRADFDEILREATKELEKNLKTIDVKQIFGGVNQRLNETTGKKLNATLQQPVSLGISDSSRSHTTFLTMAKIVVPNGDYAGDYIVVTSTTMAFVRGKILTIYIIEAFAGPETISGLKTFSQDYVRAVFTSNR